MQLRDHLYVFDINNIFEKSFRYIIITIFTVGSIISINTIARVAIYLVSAASTILARAWSAFINIYKKVVLKKDELYDVFNITLYKVTLYLVCKYYFISSYFISSI